MLDLPRIPYSIFRTVTSNTGTKAKTKTPEEHHQNDDTGIEMKTAQHSMATVRMADPITQTILLHGY
jgi:hypothetical protein